MTVGNSHGLCKLVHGNACQKPFSHKGSLSASRGAPVSRNGATEG